MAFGAGAGTLNFNHTSTNYVFAPAISGNGTVNVLAGITTLTANNTYTGATTINGGALIVNGSIASSSLTTVNSGAALLGSGTVGSTVVNTGGFLVPGPVGTPGSMTLAGNLAFQSGAFYVVQVNPTTASTHQCERHRLACRHCGGHLLRRAAISSRSYTILTAAGGLHRHVRRPGHPRLAGRLPDEPELYRQYRTAQPYGAACSRTNAANATPPTTIPPVPGLPPLPPQSSAPLPTFTVNELNVGHAIDNFFNNGGALPPAFVPLFGLTGNNLTTPWTSFPAKPRPARRRSHSSSPTSSSI